MARRTTPSSTPRKTNPFRYGWRYVKKVRANGKTELVEVPLTLEDVLYPQEGDVIPEKSVHEQERGYVAWAVRARFPNDPTVVVLSDCLINWGVPGLGDHSPDVSVFFRVRHPPDPERGTFYLRPSGGRPVLLIELVSPHTRDNDVVRKPIDYHRARVPLYVIVDQEHEGGPRQLIGLRYTRQRYVRMRPDAQGRLLLRPLGLRVGLKDNRVVLYDAATDQEIGDYTQVSTALKAEAQSRQVAEQRAHQEAQARQAAEQRVRELEEQLARLREDL